MDILHTRSKHLIQIINELERLGIERNTIPLPKIIVVGDQNVGKSSITQAMSKIDLPRASGTCTRCPIQITMTCSTETDSNWICKISLLRTHFYNPTQASKGSKAWQLKDSPDVVELKKCTSIDELESFVKLAQDAALTPGAEPNEVFDTSDNSGQGFWLKQKFSPNTVCLEISDRDIPSLSFVDLPGIINQPDSPDETYLVDLVQDLARERIRSKATLVLLACSMESDIMTSTAARIVREEEAMNRCIGILTKPDRLQAGDSITVWRDILNGSTFALEHGYFVTKQPTPAELAGGISHATAREKEETFFKSKDPWKNELQMFKNRFGTKNLQSALAQKLARLITDSLPEIGARINERLAAVEEELDKFPPEPSPTSSQEVTGLVMSFCTLLEKHLIGLPPNDNFRAEFRALIQTFSEDLQKATPDFDWPAEEETPSTPTPRSAPKTPTKRTQREAVTVISDDDSMLQPSTPTPNKRRRTAHGSRATAPLSRNGDLPSMEPRTPSSHQSKKIVRPRKYSLDDIQSILERFSQSGRSGRTNPAAVDHIILESLKPWITPLQAFIKQVRELLTNLCEDKLKSLLGLYKGTLLPGHFLKEVNVHLSNKISFFNKATMRSLRLEQYTPIMHNKELQDKFISLHTKQLTARRFRIRANEHLDAMEESGQIVRPTEGAERDKKISRDEALLKEKLGTDSYHQEVTAMAEVRSYYTLAMPRLIDNVLQSAEAELFGGCKGDLLDHVKQGLGLMEEDAQAVQDECKRLLSQDPDREVERARLKLEKSQLEKAQRSLLELRDIHESDSGATFLE
ncbi:MAG: hypothetical protein M1820_008122 [Bogoriella megaspora]|nr:MAG: hypothetical protein M1820_008122 [Bogoriella megaspora]